MLNPVYRSRAKTECPFGMRSEKAIDDAAIDPDDDGSVSDNDQSKIA